MRCEEPGWVMVADADDGRRGIWLREHDGAYELCAGREGDDLFVRLEPGLDVHRLAAVLADFIMAWEFASEIALEEGHTPRYAGQGTPV